MFGYVFCIGLGVFFFVFIRFFGGGCICVEGDECMR